MNNREKIYEISRNNAIVNFALKYYDINKDDESWTSVLEKLVLVLVDQNDELIKQCTDLLCNQKVVYINKEQGESK